MTNGWDILGVLSNKEHGFENKTAINIFNEREEWDGDGYTTHLDKGWNWEKSKKTLNVVIERGVFIKLREKILTEDEFSLVAG